MANTTNILISKAYKLGAGEVTQLVKGFPLQE